MNHATAYLDFAGEGVQELIYDDQMVDTQRLGDVHYVSKRSIISNAVDCVTYLLHCKWLRDHGSELTAYKLELAKIASGIRPELINGYIARYRVRQPSSR